MSFFNSKTYKGFLLEELMTNNYVELYSKIRKELREYYSSITPSENLFRRIGDASVDGITSEVRQIIPQLLEKREEIFKGSVEVSYVEFESFLIDKYLAPAEKLRGNGRLKIRRREDAEKAEAELDSIRGAKRIYHKRQAPAGISKRKRY